VQFAGGTPGALVFLLAGIGSAARVDLQPVGYPGCTLYAPNPNASVLGVAGALPQQAHIGVPNAPALLCLPLCLQGAALGTGLESSRAIVGQVGL
jgi:hypothetical protein